MKNKFLEAGQIVNTHGIQGEVKIVPWCDTPEFLCQFDTLYLDGRPVKVLARRVHKGNVLAKLEGVSDVNAAMVLKGKTVFIDRTGVELPDGRHFIADLIGLEVLDADSGEKLGVVADVLTPIISLVTPGMDFSAWHIGPIMIGNFINAVVSFLILAACVFAIVKGMNALMRKKEEAPAPAPEPAPSKEEVLLTEIRDLLAAKK